MVCWCIGLFSTGYLIRYVLCLCFRKIIYTYILSNSCKYPSGATKNDPYATNGIGRWTAFALTGTVIIDFCILALLGMLEGTSTPDQIRGSCHLVHVFWASLFFYGKFRKTNPEIATTAFFLEWFDMTMSCIVIFILHNAEGEDGCFDQSICIVYFVYVVMELFGWIFPMMINESWGTEKMQK